MPVSVSVPTKIRIDRTALSDHPEWIVEAVSAAVGRALANSRNAVLEPRGGYLGVAMHPPTFIWRGIPVESIDRVNLERMVAEIVRSAANAKGLFPAPDLGVPQVMPNDPSEPYDHLRGYPIAGIYSTDSYDGDQKELPVDDKHPLLFDYVPVVNVFIDRIPDEARERLVFLAYDASPEHPKGLIYRYTGATGVRWQVLITDGFAPVKSANDPDEAHLVGAFDFDGFSRYDFMGENASPMFKRVFFAPPPGPGAAEVISVPTDAEGRKKTYKDLMGSGLADNLRRHSKKPLKVTTTKFEEDITKRIDDQIDLALQNVATNVTKAVKITLGSAEVFVWMTQQDEKFLAWNGSAPLTALETIVQVPKPKKSKGTGEGGGETGGSSSGGEDNKGSQSGGGSSGSGGSGGCCGCPPDELERDFLSELFGDDGPSMECRSLRGEPALDEIGDAGELLGKQITALATKLGISECKFAGQFCYQAANTLNNKAIATQTMAETSTGDNKATGTQKGNLGSVNFTAGTSAIIDQIRDLAGAVPLISQLMATTVDVFSSDTYRCTIHGPLRGNGLSWSLKFLSDVVDMVNQAVGNLFVGACRSMLLQLLATSQDQIKKRQDSMDRYAPLFEKWIVPQITDIAELEELHSRLRNFRYAKMAQPSTPTIVASGVNWVSATTMLVASLATSAVSRSMGAIYEIVEDGGVDKIRGSNGVLWTWEDLEQGIALRRGLAEGIDPLVKQITDTPDAVKRFKGTDSIRAELEKLLKEMSDNNAEMRGKADQDAMFAFKASSISEDIPQATVRGGKYALQGIHRVAHEQIYDAFLFDSFYATGLDYLFDTEEGKAAILGFGILVGFVLLCVLVPGGAFIAFALGNMLAVHEVANAYEKKRLYGALINPDLVLSHAEVEVGLFVAWFGLVLSLIPEAGTAAKGLVAGGRAVLKGEAKAIGKMAGKAVAKRVAKELAEYAVKDLLEAFVKEITINVIINEVIQKAIAPIAQEIQHEAGVGFGSLPADEPTDLDQADFLEVLKAMETLDDEEESETAPDDGDDIPYEEVIE